MAGNIWLGLSALLYSILLFIGSQTWSLPKSDQSLFFLLSALLPPLWFCLAMSLSLSVANGGLDWLAISRGGQKVLVWVTCLTLLVVTWFSGNMRREPPDQMPWAMRPLVAGAWAMWLFPLVVLIFCALIIHPGLGRAAPPLGLHAPLAAVGGLSLLVTVGMVAEWVVNSHRHEQAKADAIVSEMDRRVQNQLAELQALDADKQLLVALGYTNRYNDAKVREQALSKIRAVPGLEDQLAAGLRSPLYEQVLIFLDASDPPDRQPLAEPARDAFLSLADSTLAAMRDRNGRVIPGNVDYDARLMLSVADKLQGLGVDYAPAIRAFRSALDEPRAEKLRFECIPAVDSWLARDAKRSP